MGTPGSEMPAGPERFLQGEKNVNLNGSVGKSAVIGGVAAAVVLMAAVAGAQDSGDILIGDGVSIHPESIASTPDGGLIIGSVAGPNVYRWSPGDATAELWITIDEVVEGGIVLGVFAHGDTAWVCADGPFGSGIGVLASYSLDSGALISSNALPDSGNGGGICNDIAVGPDGTVFVTETNGSGGGYVYALTTNEDGETGLTMIVGGASMSGADGIAFIGDTMYVNDVSAGRLYRIEIDGTVLVSFDTLTLSQPVGGPDGMRTTEDGTGMLLAENSNGRISMITVDGDTATVTSVAEGLRQVTGVAQIGDTVYAVEAEFGRLFNPDAPDPGLFYVKVLPLGM